MKQYLTVLLIIFASAFLPGCMGEDWSLCGPADNCILRYRYRDGSGADVFADHIHTVDLIFFDRQGRYVTRYYSDENSLEKLRGQNLVMEPGEYMVVAWGNTATPAGALTTLSESFMETDDGNGGRPAFYAPFVSPVTRSGGRTEGELAVYSVTVPKKGVVEKDLDFIRAYRSINVYVKGYRHPVLGPDPEMRVEITNLAYSYDYLLRVMPQRRSYSSGTSPKSTPAGVIPGTRMNTPYQEIENEINIKVSTPDGQPVCGDINLRDYLVRSGISLDALSLKEISLLIEMKDGQVDISVVDWNNNDVGPVW